jgi:hypothetical protein
MHDTNQVSKMKPFLHKPFSHIHVFFHSQLLFFIISYHYLTVLKKKILPYKFFLKKKLILDPLCHLTLRHSKTKLILPLQTLVKFS